MKNGTAFILFGVVAAMSQGACGGGSSSPSTPTTIATPTPAPTPAPPVVLLQGNFSLGSGFVGIMTAVTAPSSGSLEMTTDWTFARNDVDIAIARGTCTVAMLQADTCAIVGFADSATTKPERLRISVAAGVYTPIVANFGPDDESGAVQVVFTAGATAAAGEVPVKPWRPKVPIQLAPSR